ncbi:MAG: glycosyltransferase family 2 protein [Candidatus Woesearchaeota archaeon]
MKKIELSIVIPCKDEELTIADCIEKALRVLKKEKIDGEVIVVDNNSSDNSYSIAKSFVGKGVRLKMEKLPGYGKCLRKGFNAANGKYIIFADSDRTYDFLEIPKFIKKLRGGCDFVIGSRFKGKIQKNAMPALRYYIGNPVLTFLIKTLFNINISDSQSGFRGFRRDLLKKLDLKQNGMDFASEMLIKASKLNIKICEVPINYYPRVKGSSSKLNSFKDGFKHLAFIIKSYAKNYKKNYKKSKIKN